ncbi:MAG: hypothetical protein ACFFDI_05870 [Promethearchaeota archaeon]
MNRTVKIAILLGFGVFLLGLGLSILVPMDFIGLSCLSVISGYIFWMINRYDPQNYRLGLESVFLLVIAPAWFLYQGFDWLLALVALCITAALCHLIVADYTLELRAFHQTGFVAWTVIGGFLSIYQIVIVGLWGAALVCSFLAIILLGALKTEYGTKLAEKVVKKINPSLIVQKLIHNQLWIFLSLGILAILFAFSVFLELAILEWLIIAMRMLTYISIRQWQYCVLFFLIPIAVLFRPLNDENELIRNNTYYHKVLTVVFGFFFLGMVVIFPFYSYYDSNPYALWWGITLTESGDAALRAWQALLCVGVSFSYPLIARACKSPPGRLLFFIACCVLELAQFVWFLTD